MDSDKNNSIINKIIAQLVTVKNHKDPVEAKRIHLLAQNIMSENNIATAAVTKPNGQPMHSLDWWERKLLIIISNKLKVRYQLSTKAIEKQNTNEVSIVFIGFALEVKVAKESYELLHEVLNTSTERFIENYTKEDRVLSFSQITSAEIDSYRSGFLRGIDTQFNVIIQGKPMNIGKKEDTGTNWRYLPLFERITHYEGYVDCVAFGRRITSKQLENVQ